MINAFERAMGAREDRDPNRPHLDNGEHVGGTRWERDIHAVPIGETRCFTLAQSYQVQRNVTGPTSSSRVFGDATEHHEIRNELINVSVDTIHRDVQDY